MASETYSVAMHMWLKAKQGCASIETDPDTCLWFPILEQGTAYFQDHVCYFVTLGLTR